MFYRLCSGAGLGGRKTVQVRDDEVSNQGAGNREKEKHLKGRHCSDINRFWGKKERKESSLGVSRQMRRKRTRKVVVGVRGTGTKVVNLVSFFPRWTIWGRLSMECPKMDICQWNIYLDVCTPCACDPTVCKVASGTTHREEMLFSKS